MKRRMKPKAQFLVSHHQQLLAPLNSAPIRDIVLTRGVDEGVPKYKVMTVLKLYLFAGVLQGFFTSLRGIVALENNILAQWFTGLMSWSLNGLADANKRIPYIVFKEIYQELSTHIDVSYSISQIRKELGVFDVFDATYLQLCLKLVPWAKKQNRRAGKGQMLMSTRISDGGLVPNHINLDSNPAHCEVHFESLIDWAKTGITYLFDRGYRCIETFVKIHQSGNFFITKWNQSVSIQAVKNLLFCPERRGAIEIKRDQRVRLGKGKRKSGPVFRLISAIVYESDQMTELFLLTNRFDLDPFEVAEIYRHRWQIEIFFKWLKSHLKLTHFISYSENGVYAQIYITLILHLLLVHYHQSQQLSCRFGINTQRYLMNELMNSVVSARFLALFEKTYRRCDNLITIPPPDIHYQCINELVTYEIITN